jgi:G3E family GTPase
MAAQYCDISFQPVFQDSSREPVATRRKEEFAGIESGGKPGIRSAVIRTKKKISMEQLNRFLKENMPHTYRIKGYVRLLDDTVKAVQTSFDSCHTQTITNYSGITEIIAMGEHIEPRKLRNSLTH